MLSLIVSNSISVVSNPPMYRRILRELYQRKSWVLPILAEGIIQYGNKR